MVIPAGSPLAGKAIYEALGKSSGKVLICAVERDGEVFIPSGSFVLRAGDEISFVTSKNEAEGFFKKSGIEIGKIKKKVVDLGEIL